MKDPHDITPRLLFKIDEDGDLAYQRMGWYERSGVDDVHIEGRSHYTYSDWFKVKTLGVDAGEEHPEVVLDQITEMLIRDIES